MEVGVIVNRFLVEEVPPSKRRDLESRSARTCVSHPDLSTRGSDPVDCKTHRVLVYEDSLKMGRERRGVSGNSVRFFC